MANENNLLRPPLLNVANNNTQPRVAPELQDFIAQMIRNALEIERPKLLDSLTNAPSTSRDAQQLPIITPELQQLVSGMVRNTLEIEGRSLIGAATNNAAHVDEVIEEQFRGNLSESERIPDIVKYLKEFAGNSSEFSSWRKSVERVLEIYKAKKGTPQYFGIINVIRNKITGNADAILESYNTPLNWDAIVKCLTLHYADKRDIITLEHQLMSLVQGKSSIEEFYQEVYSHLSLILNKVTCMEIDNAAVSLLSKSYRDKALDSFVNGLNGDLPRLLGIKEPENLPQALYLCQKLSNQNSTKFSQTASAFRSSFRQPPLHPRNSGNNQRHQIPYHNQQHQFYPQIAYLPQYPRQHPQSNRNFPQPSFSQHPRQQPQYNNNFQGFPSRNFQTPNPIMDEPMDIDHSLHSQRVNYMNRPQQQHTQNFKRPASSKAAQQKRQKNFNITSENYMQEPAEDNQNDLQTENEIPDLPIMNVTNANFLE